ncbi:hypothetical protein Peur_037734 [Populus x canadensis]
MNILEHQPDCPPEVVEKLVGLREGIPRKDAKEGLFLSSLQAIATLGTYDIALEMGKKVMCKRVGSLVCHLNDTLDACACKFTLSTCHNELNILWIDFSYLLTF